MVGTEANPFDALAPFYDSWYSTPLGAVVGRHERDLLLCLARPGRGERALEVGIGTGYFAQALIEAGVHVAGVDLSLPMLRQAAGKGLPVVRGDAQALPIRREQFDLVLTVTMLEFGRASCRERV